MGFTGPCREKLAAEVSDRGLKLIWQAISRATFSNPNTAVAFSFTD
jgi:hypothetical protein